MAGRKAELLARLVNAMNNKVPVRAMSVMEKRESHMNGLEPTAIWEMLTRNDKPVPAPVNEDETMRPPTEREGETNPKYGFKETFEREEFTGTTERLAFIRRARGKKKQAPMRQAN